MLAQTWDVKLMERFGDAVAVEMEEFYVDLWLAPGMNIQRNPLCGRNFEYYSEDPYLSGMMAAAVTKGVQSHPSCGVTMKHFACNNQEDNRMGVDARVSVSDVHKHSAKEMESKDRFLKDGCCSDCLCQCAICRGCCGEDGCYETCFERSWLPSHGGR